MNLNKSREYFDPSEIENISCHIIGCGAVGSTVAENLARLGVTNIVLWDFDKVEAHNIANQMFFDNQIGMDKVAAVVDNLTRINPLINITAKHQAYKGQNLSGYIFLCVDNIDVRREIVEGNMLNPNIKAMFDFRIRLLDAQHYAAPWDDKKEKENLLNTMQFTHEEAKAQTPVSACGVELSVNPTVRLICSLGVANFMNFVRTKKVKRLILIDAFEFILDAF